MRTNDILTFEESARSRLIKIAKHCRLHATGNEAIQIDQLCAAIAAGQVTVRDGHAALTRLRQTQHQRDQANAA